MKSLTRIISAAAYLFLCGTAAPAQQWVEQSFDDFIDGTFDAAGQNLYVSRDGTIRHIHRYDFNQDGHLDLLFNSTHDNAAFVPATLAAFDGQRVHQQPLAVQGSKRMVWGDLNRDGHQDLVFLRSRSGIQGARSLLTIIWGGADGWPAHRSSGALPEPHYASDLALADLNHDGWLDLAVFGGGGSPKSFIYWGSAQGMHTGRRSDIDAIAGSRAAGGDLDNDGIDDLVIAGAGRINIIWGAAGSTDLQKLAGTQLPSPGGYPHFVLLLPTGEVTDLAVARGERGVDLYPASGSRQWAEPIHFDIPATHLASGDLDGDGHGDLVLTHFEQTLAAGGEEGAAKASGESVRILWGGDDGFAASRSTPLPATFATSTAVTDLDGDNAPDIAVAIYQGDSAYKGESIIFRRSGTRAFTAVQQTVTTQAATDVVAIPATASLPAQLVFCNSQAGTLGEKVPLDLYWGTADGFDSNRRWQIPFASGSESSAADLNADGFVDLIITLSGHGGQSAETDETVGTHILWGDHDGFDLDRRSILRQDKIWCTNVADVNRDGFLDIIACAESGVGGREALLHIYHGSDQGYSVQRQQAIEVGGRALGAHVGDLNNDGWLDIVSTDYYNHRVSILWGNKDGYSRERLDTLEVDRALGIEIADLNSDGLLDLIVGRYSDAAGENYDLGSFVYWGSRDGFSHANAQWLPGLTAVDFTVADFDGDGHLDIFSSNYHATSMREAIPCYLFWGSEGGFDPQRKTNLTVDSASGALAGDFNGDGMLDIAVIAHTRHGNHETLSRIYFNDGRRFAQPRFQELPSVGGHWMDMHDMGHIHDRSFRQRYTSSVFRWSDVVSEGRIEFEADLPQGCLLQAEVRSAASEAELEAQPWRAVEKQQFDLRQADRCLQYRAVFVSDNGDRYPALRAVRISLAE